MRAQAQSLLRSVQGHPMRPNHGFGGLAGLPDGRPCLWVRDENLLGSEKQRGPRRGAKIAQQVEARDI